MTNYSPENVEALARKFSELLKKELSDEQIEEIIQKNKTAEYQGCCASHDYTDSNVING